MEHAGFRHLSAARPVLAWLAGAWLALLTLPALAQEQGFLPSWNDAAAKARIVSFVESVTDPTGADYVPPAERVAVFDNDGTLWSEQPLYFQLAFILDRIRALAPQHPEWQALEPFRSVLAGDMAGIIGDVTGSTGLYGAMMSGELPGAASGTWGGDSFGVGLIRPDSNIHGVDEHVSVADMDLLTEVLLRFLSGDRKEAAWRPASCTGKN